MASSVVGVQETVTLGGTTLLKSNAIVLMAVIGAGTKYQTFRKSGANYQITSGKTFRAVGMKVITSNSSNSEGPRIGTGTAAVNDSASAPAGDVAIAGGGIGGGYGTTAPSYGSSQEMPVSFNFASTLFPYAECVSGLAGASGGMTVIILGYEE